MSANESPKTVTRRQMMTGAAALAGVAAISGSRQAAGQTASASPISLYENDVFLFQGDSITDAGRGRYASDRKINKFDSLGQGYANMISCQLMGIHAERRPQCFNNGISGNKVPDLQARWQKDTIDLQPQVLSILIGVNDFWHTLNGKYDGTVEQYETGFTELLAQTREALPKTVLVICEPFVLRCGAVNETWFPEFDERRAAAKRVAEGAGAIWVPFQTMFEEATASEATPPSYWAGDGVHPTLAGHALMARTWLEVTGLTQPQPIV